MFLAPIVMEEEMREYQKLRFGKAIKEEPSFLKHAYGTVLKDLALRCGIDLDRCFYTSIVRYLPDDKKKRTTPSKAMINQCTAVLENDIAEVRPDIVVCVGKKAFDFMSDIRYKESEVMGDWFWNKKYRCRYYMIPHITKLSNPEMGERFMLDLRAIRTMWDALTGNPVEKRERTYVTVRNMKELTEFVEFLRTNNHRLLAVDCEWDGFQFYDCKLRSLQIAWSPFAGAYIRFMDEDMNYAFDAPYKDAGRVLGGWLDRDDVKYIGHHISVDLPCMYHWLGLNWYNKTEMDTEFAYQCCNESGDRGLKMLALIYTDLGRYDHDLIAWKKANPKLCADGYGRIPDDILIPYGINDVLTTYAVYEGVKPELERQGLTRYYNEIFGPFSSNVFTSFCLTGLPADVPRMDAMRRLYNYARDEMEKDFIKEVCDESEVLLRNALIEATNSEVLGNITYEQVKRLVTEGKQTEATSYISNVVDNMTKYVALIPFFQHYANAPDFNIRSTDQMRRWLFDVKKYEPIMSTGNKSAGLPSTPWEKVMSYPPDRQREFTPACDKQTLQILQASHSDKLLTRLLQFNAIGNVCKAFMKPSEVDKVTGELIAEKGLHAWLASDNKIHTNTSSTETGRPRSWNPNVLNWPGYIHIRLAEGVAHVLWTRHKDGTLPDDLRVYLPDEELDLKAFIKYVSKHIPTIRSIVQAPPGWCAVESDYQTAEMRGLAFISGDKDLIRLITEPDPMFAKVKPEFSVNDDCVCRLDFPPGITLPGKEAYLMTYTEDEKILARFTPDQLMRDVNGNIVHAKYDMHWSLAEMVTTKPREALIKKAHRTGTGKVGNFSTAYGAGEVAVERKIESETGIKPEPGTGARILEAIAKRQPKATQFLNMLGEIPQTEDHITAASGRIRHFSTLAGSSFDDRTVGGQMSALGREAKNYFMQESVASTSGRAGNWLLELKMKNGLRGYPSIILYDSVVTICPDCERHIWIKAHTLYMFRANGWRYDDRLLTYPIDTELNQGWSDKPSKERESQLNDDSYEPTPEYLKYIEDWLDTTIKTYEDNPWLAAQPQTASK